MEELTHNEDDITLTGAVIRLVLFILIIVFLFVGVSKCNRFVNQVETNANKYLGQKVVFDSDTNIVARYNEWNGDLTLSNGKVVNYKAVKLLK